ncbi:hypothetical protein CHS0354_025766 [Potamilus streckersoni]|uniref:Uncharacterized protein n=1 Tax=Potamilus streckersoni TaxID=2493646 RepID=A0AAE0RUG9_9BIVA|nr:hypothetical protein CHS0354_025766 [Potamilus streckersoni]
MFHELQFALAEQESEAVTVQPRKCSQGIEASTTGAAEICSCIDETRLKFSTLEIHSTQPAIDTRRDIRVPILLVRHGHRKLTNNNN